MACVVVTLLVIGFLIVEHYLSDDLYEGLKRNWSPEYVRRHRIALKLVATVFISYCWILELFPGTRSLSLEIFWLIAVLTVAVGIWVLLGKGVRKI